MCNLFAHAESFNARDWINIEEAPGTCYKQTVSLYLVGVFSDIFKLWILCCINNNMDSTILKGFL